MIYQITQHCVMNIVKFVLYSWELNASRLFVLTQFNSIGLLRSAFIKSEFTSYRWTFNTGNIGCAFVFTFIVFIRTKYLQKSKTFARKENTRKLHHKFLTSVAISKGQVEHLIEEQNVWVLFECYFRKWRKKSRMWWFSWEKTITFLLITPLLTGLAFQLFSLL